MILSEATEWLQNEACSLVISQSTYWLVICDFDIQRS